MKYFALSFIALVLVGCKEEVFTPEQYASFCRQKGGEVMLVRSKSRLSRSGSMVTACIRSGKRISDRDLKPHWSTMHPLLSRQ